MKITIDFDNEEEQKQVKPEGVYPLTIENLGEFVLCGTRVVGSPVAHRHGHPTNLIRYTAMLTEDLRSAITQQIVKGQADATKPNSG